jgi:hypothetical protein
MNNLDVNPRRSMKRHCGWILILSLCTIASSCGVRIRPLNSACTISETSLSLTDIGSVSATSRSIAATTGSLYNEVTVDLGADFLDTNICGTKTIFGRAGTATCAVAAGRIDSIVGSNISRDKGGTPSQIKIEDEAAALAAGYRLVPDASKDDDANAGTAVTKATRPTVVCGMAIATIAGRITDCATRNGANASWDGAVNGNSGESSWTLVTVYKTAGLNGDACAGTCLEVWKDNRTELYWSDKLSGVTTNWCRASGNVQNSGGVDCSAGGVYQPATPQSWCTEVAGFTTPAAADPGKGGMLATSTGTTPSIIWRLPTRNDLYQAEIDGIRFVTPATGYNIFWTATVDSNARTSAWRFHNYGIMQSSARTGAEAVRCVGRAP